MAIRESATNFRIFESGSTFNLKKELLVKKTTTFFLGVAFAAAAFAQDKPAAPAAGAQSDPIVMTAGDITIRQSEFEAVLRNMPAEYQQYVQTGPGKKQVAERYLRMKMLAAEGLRNGVDKDPDVARQLAVVRDEIVANGQVTRIDKSVTVKEEDLRKTYEAHKGDYEEVKARHILIAFKGSPVTPKDKKELTEEEAKAKAEDLRKQIAGGAKFEDLAKKESDDTSSGAQGGELGTFGRGQMVPEFEKVAFEAKAGDLTPVVRTQFGYHVIKVEEKKTTPFEQVRETLEKQQRQEAVQSALDALTAKSKPVYNDAYFGPATPAAPAAPAAPAGDAKPAADAKKPGH